jgi:hypothetical protein
VSVTKFPERPVAPGAVKVLAPHENRVVQERIQLAEKVNSLEEFILSEPFKKVVLKERKLLSQQLEHMVMYLKVLDVRAARFNGAKRYICNKEVMAYPMNRLGYNTMRGWDVPADENPADAGYLVEYLDGGRPNHPGFAGYISWSPKSVFENGYKEIA